ncbi:MAG: hypothetical protein ABL897_01620 [Hyphomicrobium sp.]
MHTHVLATIYAKLPPAQLKRVGAPSPQLIADGMNKRFVNAFVQYKVTVSDADDFKKLVETHGVPLFIKTVFPKGAGVPQGAAPAAGN